MKRSTKTWKATRRKRMKTLRKNWTWWVLLSSSFTWHFNGILYENHNREELPSSLSWSLPEKKLCGINTYNERMILAYLSYQWYRTVSPYRDILCILPDGVTIISISSELPPVHSAKKQREERSKISCSRFLADLKACLSFKNTAFPPWIKCNVLQGQHTKLKKPVFNFWVAPDLTTDLGNLASALYVSVSQSEKWR